MSVPHFTVTELEVGECRGRGWECVRIAEWLGIAPSTVQTHINRMAAKIPNPDCLKPMDLVLYYFAHREWLARHGIPPQNVA